VSFVDQFSISPIISRAVGIEDHETAVFFAQVAGVEEAAVEPGIVAAEKLAVGPPVGPVVGDED
jgi:hypothetical protein